MPTMPDYLSIKNFNNPAGVASSSRLIIDNLMRRYDSFISKDISIKIYKDGKSFVFKLKIPSEKNYRLKTDIFYDVIIEFYPLHGTTQENDKKIVDYGMRVFSNCPTNTFMFTYVYNKMGALYRKIPQSMYSEKALNEPAKKTNPYKLVGIEKSIFYSLRKIYEVTSYTKDKIEKLAIKLPENDPSFKFPGNLFEDIKSQTDKMKEILSIEKIPLIRKRKKKASSATISLNVGGKTLTSDEFGNKKSNNLGSNLKSDINNYKLMKENNDNKANSLSSKIGKSKLKK